MPLCVNVCVCMCVCVWEGGGVYVVVIIRLFPCFACQLRFEHRIFLVYFVFISFQLWLKSVSDHFRP